MVRDILLCVLTILVGPAGGYWEPVPNQLRVLLGPDVMLFQSMKTSCGGGTDEV